MRACPKVASNFVRNMMIEWIHPHSSGVLFLDVEKREVDVYARSMGGTEPICDIAFGCDDALLDAGGRITVMATDTKNTFASIVILNFENRSSVGPQVVGIDEI